MLECKLILLEMAFSIIGYTSIPFQTASKQRWLIVESAEEKKAISRRVESKIKQ
ncbi:hypothetical protein VV11_012765 [Trichodesmium erythraeum 21-75]|nr:hypothetical protein [Trichodesmium erythraeum 21-75]